MHSGGTSEEISGGWIEVGKGLFRVSAGRGCKQHAQAFGAYSPGAHAAVGECRKAYTAGRTLPCESKQATERGLLSTQLRKTLDRDSPRNRRATKGRNAKDHDE
eukprot:1143677-Pelagomonas_calceolata.AAC.3